MSPEQLYQSEAGRKVLVACQRRRMFRLRTRLACLAVGALGILGAVWVNLLLGSLAIVAPVIMLVMVLNENYYQMEDLKTESARQKLAGVDRDVT